MFYISDNPTDTLWNLAYMIFHEFSHSYVNPLVDEYFDMIKGRAELFEPIKTKMTMLAYPDWWIAVVEHFVRASETRLMQLFLHPMHVKPPSILHKSRLYLYGQYLKQC